MSNFEHLHFHTHYSNLNSYFEVVNTEEQYVEKAKQMGFKSLAISEHGNVMNWAKKKMLAEQNGLKYVHACEMYVTDSLEEKVRDNYHLLLIAKTESAVYELNELVSKSFNRQDNHYYYRQRISFEELSKTSDDILILTACLASPLYQHYKNQNTNEFKKWVNFFVENKHRVWLELQPHWVYHNGVNEQAVFNKLLLQMAEQYDMNIVATNDVHTIDAESDKLRKIMKVAKKANYDYEDDFELYYKSREEMEEGFRKQGVLTEEQIKTACDNTVRIVDLVEEFELDDSFKYPEMYDNPLEKLQGLIMEGYVSRGISLKPEEEQRVYKERVVYELKTYIKTQSVNYLLLEWTVKHEMKQRGVFPGYGRGSVSGSIIAYLLGITEMDSVRLGLSFERFMNPDRVSLADIDTDYWQDDRVAVQEYLLTHKDLDCASIVTIGTFQVKAAIDSVTKGMTDAQGNYRYTLEEVAEIKSHLVEEGTNVFAPEWLKDEHEELFGYVEKLIGVAHSVGRHAAGVVVSTRNVDAEIGTLTISNFPHKVTQWTMKPLDKLNWVKLDILGLDNIYLINRTAEFAGLPRLTPDSMDIIDFQDEKVWESITEENMGIFQFEGDRAGKIIKETFSKQTLERIREKLPNINYIQLFSLCNAAQRPSGASYIDAVMEGRFKDNGHEALNEFLGSTLGYLVYQEQQTQWLVDYCGWTTAHADLIRRGIGKKDQKVMDEEVPKIKPTFIKTMVERYGDTKEHAEEVADSFIQVFMDAVNYGFSINHSLAYSYVGYISAWLRYYYPLEFCTVALEIWDNDQEKTKKILDYASKHNINIKPIQFRFSRGGYFFDKDTNTIYQGTAPLKGCNGQAGESLYTLKDESFSSFSDLLLRIHDDSVLTIDGISYTMSELYELDINEIKAIDKDISNSAKYGAQDYNPFYEKTVQKAFQKWLYSDDPESSNVLELMGLAHINQCEEVKIDYFRDPELKTLIDSWMEEKFKGKRSWEVDLKEIEFTQGSPGVNKTNMEALIKLNFFSEFGGNKKLLAVYENFRDSYKASNKTFKGKAEKFKAVKEFEKNLADCSFGVIEQIEFEKHYVGRITANAEAIDPKYFYVVGIINKAKNYARAMLYSISKGQYVETKTGNTVYRNVPFEEGDILEVNHYDIKPKPTKIDGQWTKSETEVDLWLKNIRFIRKVDRNKTDG